MNPVLLLAICRDKDPLCNSHRSCGRDAGAEGFAQSEAVSCPFHLAHKECSLCPKPLMFLAKGCSCALASAERIVIGAEFLGSIAVYKSDSCCGSKQSFGDRAFRLSPVSQARFVDCRQRLISFARRRWRGTRMFGGSMMRWNATFHVVNQDAELIKPVKTQASHVRPVV